ncbi:MAG: hypothetical protein HZA81_01965 [Candidatus Taylorbacteria bacterium]|nr:hypothetical protein [Candidatus Taylorbacteria bacterium]
MTIKPSLLAVAALALVSLCPLSLLGATGVGFVKSPLWFSKSSFAEGETVKIFTALQNSSDSDLRGRMVFYSDGKEIGSSSFSILSGNSEVIWSKFSAEAGSHRFSAKIVGGTLEGDDGSTEPVAESATEAIEIAVLPRPADAPKKDYVASATDWLIERSAAVESEEAETAPSEVSDLIAKIDAKNSTVKGALDAVKGAIAKADEAIESAQEKLLDKSREYRERKKDDGTASPFDNAAALFFAAGSAFLGWKTAVYLIALYALWKAFRFSVRTIKGIGSTEE